MAAAMNTPTIGMKRMSIAMMPHKMALGMPMNQSPTPMAAPKPAFITTSVRK